MPGAFGKCWPKLRSAVVRKSGPEFEQPGCTHADRYCQVLITAQPTVE
jgi:hypothetical protein